MKPPKPSKRHDSQIKDPQPQTSRRGGGRLVGLGTLLVLVALLCFGAWKYHSRAQDVNATHNQLQNFVPTVHVAEIKASGNSSNVILPATTSAFQDIQVFARASGYIEQREVDIGDHVKKGQLLAKIAVPELDDQILEAQATLGQLQATLKQAQANADLAQVTWDRDKTLVTKGWDTQQQGTIDVETVKAQEATVGVAQANVKAQQDQLQVLNQQKLYQQVVAPFDGIITQRNIDKGSLVQADTTSGTFMFALMQDDVIRTQVFVPQDAAFGISPGDKTIIHVPEIPGRVFTGTVTRMSDSLQPGTRTLLAEIDVPNTDGCSNQAFTAPSSCKSPARRPVFQSRPRHLSSIPTGCRWQLSRMVSFI
ncbi:efflux RND transporter periplasmic adaptor subunit [Candidatus Phyllobacterium onerii]|uniref:efflux RND transporter periplasmic adaptor subunit n=1 Tax=Candidatus Phyllobacterium onerii TaxID=3020828 RepID=UPI00232D4322|nr:efflux RND transporter periplasmic adaptor subunit [Phyllobacterium sp. IY22]